MKLKTNSLLQLGDGTILKLMVPADLRPSLVSDFLPLKNSQEGLSGSRMRVRTDTAREEKPLMAATHFQWMAQPNTYTRRMPQLKGDSQKE
jgi:hypothetical protein